MKKNENGGEQSIAVHSQQKLATAAMRDVSLRKMKIKKEISICKWQNVQPIKPEPNSIIGLAVSNLENGIIHGLRHFPESKTNGWYIWTGEYSEKEDFFKPVCLEHLNKYLKIDLTQYLELPPGFRFLIDGNNYEDVWFDKDLLK